MFWDFKIFESDFVSYKTPQDSLMTIGATAHDDQEWTLSSWEQNIWNRCKILQLVHLRLVVALTMRARVAQKYKFLTKDPDTLMVLGLSDVLALTLITHSRALRRQDWS